MANVGVGRRRGVEAELNLAPTADWTLDASGGYMDAKYQSILPGVPLTGREKFVNTPKFQAQAGTAYTIEAGTVGSFTPRVDWTYRSEEHTSELQSLIRIPYAVFRLKKKKK